MNPLPNTQTGIQLAQAGKRAEALPYLRRAVQSEAISPEVWLWLAHVTQDVREYQYCVQQALNIDPQHAVAHQMLTAFTQAYPHLVNAPFGQTGQIALSGGTSQSLQVDAQLINAMERKNRIRKRRRFLLVLIGLILLAGIAVSIGLILTDNPPTSENEEEQGGKAIGFTFRADNNSWRFAVQAPETWLLADENDPAWVETRNLLSETFPSQTTTTWQQVETDLGDVTLDSSGTLARPITLIETDPVAITRQQGFPAHLQLVGIRSIDNVSCEGMRDFAASQQDALAQENDARQNVVENHVEEATRERCVFVIHYRDQSPLSRLFEHIYVIYVPAAENQVAEWHFNVIDDAHADSLLDIQRIIGTLRAISP